MKKIVLMFAIAIVAFGCNKDDDGDSTPTNAAITFKFTQNWDGTAVTPSNYTAGVYENAAGNFVSISKLRYLISRIVLHKADGSSVALMITD